MSDFEQVVAEAGYSLEKVRRENDGPVEFALLGPGTSERRSYRPLVDESALFVKFGRLGDDPSPGEISEFADRYGRLGLLEPGVLARSDSAGEPVVAEFLDVWTDQLRLFVPCLKLWNAIRDLDTDYLRRVIHWSQDGSRVSYQSVIDGDFYEFSRQTHLAWWDTVAPGSLEPPARLALSGLVTEQLARHCHPALGYREEQVGFAISLSCRNLLGCLWLQFAQAIERGIGYRECVQCGQPFHPSPSERGKKKRFCTDSCKSKNYREGRVRSP